MFIHMEFIQKEFAEKLSFVQLLMPSKLSAFKMWEPSLTVLDDAVLYLCTADDFLTLSEMQIKDKKKNFLVLGEITDIPDSLKASNILVCPSDGEDDLLFINKLGMLFYSYNAWQQKLLQHFSNKSSLQDLLDTGYELIQYPMCILDANHQVLAINEITDNDDPLFACLLGGYGYPYLEIISHSTPTLEEAEAAGVVENINNLSHKRIRVTKIRVTPFVSYYFGIHKDDNQPFHPADIALFQIFVEYLERFVSLTYADTVSDKGICSSLLEEMILSSNIDREILLQQLEQKQIANNGDWQLLSLKFTKHLKFRTNYHYEIVSKIKKVLPDCYFALIGSYIAILIPCKTDIKTCIQKLQPILTSNSALCACSSLYHDLTATHMVWKQLMFMFDYGESASEDHALYYEDYYIKHYMHIIHNEFPSETLFHSAFDKLHGFDQKNHTDYLRTLICYLQNNCSVNTTSDILNIHRNSLLYRIRKIEELLNFEISSSEERPYMLFASFLISHFDEQSRQFSAEQ